MERDFKKWWLYHLKAEGYQQQYELYEALHKKQEAGSFRCQVETDNMERVYRIESDLADFPLVLNQQQRHDFLDYLRKTYFQTDEVDNWYAAKQQEEEKVNRPVEQAAPIPEKKGPFQVKPHRKERRYFRIKAGISILFYLSMALSVVQSYVGIGWGGLVGTMAVFAGGALLFKLMSMFFHGYFVGMIKGQAVQLNEQQYSEIALMVEEQAKMLGMDKLPEIYLMEGKFNAFVMKFARKHLLVLHSEVVETALRGDKKILNFVIAHELGHIKRKHLSKGWLFPSLFIPFLEMAYSRGCEYTCDRIGFHASPQGAIDGMLVMTVGAQLYTKIDPNQYVEDMGKNGGFWLWFAEKFKTHPHLVNRITALKQYRSYL